MTKATGAKRGRPTKVDYDAELGQKICDRLADGATLREIDKMEGMPPRRTIHRWLLKFPEFAKMYAIARDCQADHMDDLVMQCAAETDNSNYHAMRVKIWAYQWRAGKLAPQRYGDSQRLEHKGRIAITRDPEDDKMV